jgi:hypothetical protein
MTFLIFNKIRAVAYSRREFMFIGNIKENALIPKGLYVKLVARTYNPFGIRAFSLILPINMAL